MTDPERPQCEHSEPSESCDHTGWEHATSFEEIQEALRKDEIVYDRDGDVVHRIKIGTDTEGEKKPGIASVYYDVRGEHREGSYNISIGDPNNYSLPGYILVREVPVTDEDVQAAIASILGGG